jgi:hypothetical protein
MGRAELTEKADFAGRLFEAEDAVWREEGARILCNERVILPDEWVISSRFSTR